MKKHPKADTLTQHKLAQLDKALETLPKGMIVEPPAVESYDLGEQEKQTVAQLDNQLLQSKLALADRVMQARATEFQVQAAQDKMFELVRALLVSRGIAADGSNWMLQIDQGKLVRQV